MFADLIYHQVNLDNAFFTGTNGKNAGKGKLYFQEKLKTEKFFLETNLIQGHF